MSKIIFDFDGTLADSLEVILGVFYDITGKKPVSDAEMKRLRKLPVMSIATQFGLHWWQVPRLLRIGRKQMANHIDKVKVYPGIDKMVKDLHEDGHELFVMSSNSVSNVRKVLANYDIEKYFEHVYGGAGLLGKGQVLKKLIRSHKWSKDDCLYVGDEVRDIEGAFEAGIRCISVEWGFSDSEALKLLNPHALISKPSQLVKIVSKS